MFGNNISSYLFQCCEKIREKLENCDILVDLQEYIQNNKTGSIRPGEVL